MEDAVQNIGQGKEHNEKDDYWVLGILTYKFMIGNPPFEDWSRIWLCIDITITFMYGWLSQT